MNRTAMKSGKLTIGDTTVHYVLHRSSKRKRTVALSIEPDLSLCITAPTGTKTSSIEGIVRRRSAWIIRKLADIKEYKSSLHLREFISGETITFLGKQYILRVTRDVRAETGCLIQDGVLLVNMKNDWLTGENLRQEVRFEIASWYKKQAKKKLKSRAGYWSKKLGINFRSLIISNPHKRWGSCDPHNNIRLNWRIVMAPLSLVDYVVVHELCHVPHKNHSEKFWQLLGNFIPDYDSRKKLLRIQGSSYELF